MTYKSHILVNTFIMIYRQTYYTMNQLINVRLTWDYRNVINLAVKGSI